MAVDDLTMTYSAILQDKDNKKIVRVSFERNRNGKKEVAEAVLPQCSVVRQNGYSDEEITVLEEYMKNNLDDIMGKAKIISNPLKWL